MTPSDKSSWFAPSLKPAATVEHSPAVEARQLEPTPELQGRRLEAVMVHVKEFVATVDSEWRFTFVNQQFLRTFGMTSPLQALGKTPFDLYPGFRQSVFFSAMDEVMTRRKDVSRVGFSENTKKWYLCRGYPVNGGAALLAADISGSVDNAEKLISFSVEDPLTGMANRVALESEISARFSAGDPFDVAVFGLDRFKNVVDALGRSAGDRIVLEVASRMAAVSKDGVRAFRIEGHEFAIVASLQGEAFVSLVERICGKLAEPILIKDVEVGVSASAGIVHAPADGSDMDTLLRRADIAMARARTAHMGTVVTYDATMESRVVDRLRIERELRKRVLGGQLEMRYRARFDVRTGAPVGFDGQIQWGLGSDVIASDAEILAVAAECGLMSDIDAWSIETAIRHTSKVKGARLTAPILAPLSSAMLCSPATPGRIKAWLDQNRASASSLQIEVTGESLVMDMQANSSVLAELAKLGVRSVVSDVGAGKNVLGCLARSGAHAVKVEDALVGRITEDNGSRVIVSALVGLAHELGMEVIAEGVSSSSQLEMLRQMKCDAAQGNACAQLLPIDEAVAVAKAKAASSPVKVNPYE